MNPEATVDFREIVLHKLKAASRAHLSAALDHDSRADVYVDQMTQRVAMNLSAYVLSDRLLKDDQSASFSKEVVIEQDAPRGLVLPPAALVLGLTALGLAMGSLAVLLAAMVAALMAVALFAVNPPQTHRRTVSGTVTIPVTSYATFPETTIVYPRDLGRIVKFMEPGPPSWETYVR